MVRVLALFVMLLSFGAPAFAQEIPTYEIDPGHTRVSFTINHLGYSMMPGFFNDITGVIRFDPKDVGQSRVDVKIKTDSITMGHAVLDKKLREPEYFNTKQYPIIRFRGTRIETTGMETGILTGNLTFLGVTRPVELKVRFNKKAWNSYMNTDVIGFSATGKINRSDFGMKTSLPDVGDEVKLRISVEAFVPSLEMKLKKQGKKEAPVTKTDTQTLVIPNGGKTGGVGYDPNKLSPFTRVPTKEEPKKQ